MSRIIQFQENKYYDLDQRQLYIDGRFEGDKLTTIPHNILEYLAKNSPNLLSEDQIRENCWPHSKDNSRGNLSGHISIIRDRIQDYNHKYIETVGNMYRCNYSITEKEELVNIKSLIEYYKKLWVNHCRGYNNNGRNTTAILEGKELIDYFVIPRFEMVNNMVVPFKMENHSVFVNAASGFGKTTLLDMLLLCTIIDELFKYNSDVLSENSITKKDYYDRISKVLLGEGHDAKIPVFIHANSANTKEYTSALELAEVYGTEDFIKIVNKAKEEKRLLFFIDAIDEVQTEKMNTFLSSLNNLLVIEYPNSSIVFSSRFTDRQSYQFDFPYSTIGIGKLRFEDVESITKSVSVKNAVEIIKWFDSNEFIKQLVTNPFMLMTVLNSDGVRTVHELLENIVNSIIDKRWTVNNFGISSEKTRLLIGYLACEMVFSNSYITNRNQISNSFNKAKKEMEGKDIEHFDPSKCEIDILMQLMISQSGILTMVDHNSIVFQDELVMVWLAANYLERVVFSSDSLIEDMLTVETQYWINAAHLNKITHLYSNNVKTIMSDNAINVILMLASRCPTLVRTIHYFFLFKYSVSMDIDERKSILEGYKKMINNAFGDIKTDSVMHEQVKRILENIK